MKLMIDIPEDAYEAYKEWDKSGVATVEQTIIANGTPIQTVNNAEEAEAYPIAENIPISKEEQEENCRIVREFLRDVAQAKDLPECKECRTCKHCMRNKKMPKITWKKGYPFIFCVLHHEHFAPNDTCGFYMEGNYENNSKSDRCALSIERSRRGEEE